MFDIAFADACRPARCVILRTPLLDYSIGHELLLQSQHNPLVTLAAAEFNKLPGAEQTLSVIRAVLVCSRTWAENRQPFRWVKLWTWANRKSDMALAIAEFRNYRSDGSTFPRFDSTNHDPDNKPTPQNAPFLAKILHAVQHDFDLPLGCALWTYFSMLEDEGRITILLEAEKTLDEQIAGHEADFAREQAEKKKREGG